MHNELSQLPSGLSWVACQGQIPANAVRGGWDARLNGPFYIGRSGHKGCLIPGKVNPTGDMMYIGHGGDELRRTNYEVLVQDDQDLMLEWIPYSGGQVPPGAVRGGVEGPKSKNPLMVYYIGRTIKNHKGGNQIPGKIHPIKGQFYFASGNSEHSRTEYEALAVSDPDCYEYQDVVYDLRSAFQTDLPPENIDVMQATNKGDMPSQFKLAKKVSASSSSNWGHQVGLKVGIKAKGKAGVPFVAEGEIEVSAEASYTHTWGHAKVDTHESNVEVSISVPARSTCKCMVVAKKKKIDVPYTATVQALKGANAGRSWKTSGIYRGVCVTAFDVVTEAAVPLSSA